MEAIPAGSKVADGRALVFSSGGARPASKASSIYDQETQPIDWVASPSIYDMETQPIVAADEPFISETQTFEFRVTFPSCFGETLGFFVAVFCVDHMALLKIAPTGGFQKSQQQRTGQRQSHASVARHRLNTVRP